MKKFATFHAKASAINQKWLLIDARGKVLGRLAAEITHRLLGKGKPECTPGVVTGDYVIVTYAKDVVVTGNKERDKIVYRHSGYPGGLTARSLGKVRELFPERLLQKAVKGMLPKGPLGNKLFRNLKICVGPSHPYQAQQPEILEI